MPKPIGDELKRQKAERRAIERKRKKDIEKELKKKENHRLATAKRRKEKSNEDKANGQVYQTLAYFGLTEKLPNVNFPVTCLFQLGRNFIKRKCTSDRNISAMGC